MNNFTSTGTLEQNEFPTWNNAISGEKNELLPSEIHLEENSSIPGLPRYECFGPDDNVDRLENEKQYSQCRGQLDESVKCIGKIRDSEVGSFVFEPNERELSPIPKISDNDANMLRSSCDKIDVTKRRFSIDSSDENAMKRIPLGLFVIKQKESDRSNLNEDSNFMEDEELIAINCCNKDDSEVNRDSDLFVNGRSCARFLQSEDSFSKNSDENRSKISSVIASLPNPVSGNYLGIETMEKARTSSFEYFPHIGYGELTSIQEENLPIENQSPDAAVKREYTTFTECEPFVPINDASQVFDSCDSNFAKIDNDSDISSQFPTTIIGNGENNCKDLSNFNGFSASDDVTSIGLSSQVFIQKLRGAAFRRRMNLTRSRDSLAAKEKVHRQAIAASKAARTKLVVNNIPIMSNEPAPLPEPLISVQFKARRVPQTTGARGAGGLSGVPKVAKRPATVPASPLLGRKRYPHKLLQRSKYISADKKRSLLRPSSNSLIPNFGVSGIPKVEKKPTTVPISPGLGRRRSRPTTTAKVKNDASSVTLETLLDQTTKSSIEPRSFRHPSSFDGKETVKVAFEQEKISQPAGLQLSDSNLSRKFGNLRFGSSPSLNPASRKSLVGLRLLDNTYKENPATPRRSKSMGSISLAFVPHSTDRAKKRAEFDTQRLQNERLRLEKEREARLFALKELKNELNILKDKI